MKIGATRNYTYTLTTTAGHQERDWLEAERWHQFSRLTRGGESLFVVRVDAISGCQMAEMFEQMMHADITQVDTEFLVVSGTPSALARFQRDPTDLED